MGRATQGVRLIKVREDDSIAAVAKVMKDDDDELEETLLDADGEIIAVEIEDKENGTPIANSEEE
jgi:DNA gyrase subunit A